MSGYIPHAPEERREMLHRLGMQSAAELFSMVPESIRLEQATIPAGKSELETREILWGMAGENKVYESIFRGAGAYDHFIPAAVTAIGSDPAFVTAYTPYQPEISQGILQSIFEYQTMICRLTDMDVSNASVYDGFTAAAEGAAMCRTGKRTVTYVSQGVHPMLLDTVKTYAFGAGTEVRTLPLREGKTDLAGLDSLPEDAACVLFQQPNFYGLIEDASAIVEKAHLAGVKAVMSVNPIAAALLKTPGQCGADVAVGEGQPLGMPLSFGGPYLGFMAATSAMMRKLPGRIVGETQDAAGNRAFVLTLQAREQHIRREKAGSNICSNEALCALTAAAYLSAMGPEGFSQAAKLCYSKAHYLAKNLLEAGLTLRYPGEFFHEFVTDCPADPEKLLNALAEEGILGGLPVEEGLLWCVTEKRTKAQMDRLVAIVKEALR